MKGLFIGTVRDLGYSLQRHCQSYMTSYIPISCDSPSDAVNACKQTVDIGFTKRQRLNKDIFYYFITCNSITLHLKKKLNIHQVFVSEYKWERKRHIVLRNKV